MKQFVAAQRQAFPGLRITVEGQVADGDMVATRWTARGTRQADRGTGELETSAGMTLARLAGGKVLEDWTICDALDLLPLPGRVTRPEPADQAAAPEIASDKETAR